MKFWSVNLQMVLALKDPFADKVVGFIFLSGLTILVGVGLTFWWQSASIRRRLRKFLGRDYRNRPVVNRSFSVIDLPNIRRGIDAFVKERSAQLEILTTNGDGLQQESLRYSAPLLHQCEVDYEVSEDCLTNPLYLISTDTERWAIQARGINSYNPAPVLEVMSLTQEKASQCLLELRKLMKFHSIYRGKVISIENSAGMNDLPDGDPGMVRQLKVRFHRLPPVTGDAIILPREVMNTIQRNTVRFFGNVNRLSRYGFSAKRGLLFHGPPGTGKTRTACWLTHSLPGVTVLLVTGEQLWNIKVCCSLARELSPAMLILEDVDLIATRRDLSVQTTALHQLMNEMDGLDAECEVLFLLTTNQPEQIEPALANRPGRIDQAIHFPLPDNDCRRRLIELYRGQIELELRDWSPILDRTQNASPAFIKEMVRKAVMIAIEELTDESTPAVLRERHLVEALNEMTRGDGNVTRRITGFAPQDDD